MTEKQQAVTDARSLRNALGRYPTGVAIVTAVDESRQPFGMTINSFASVSLSPPLISWCIDRRAASYAAFCRTGRFAVTVLSEQQAELAYRFATRGANKFRDIPLHGCEPPVIPGGCAWYLCETHGSIPLGDHSLLIGHVIDFAATTERPLVFADGQFRSLGRDAVRQAA